MLHIKSIPSLLSIIVLGFGLVGCPGGGGGGAGSSSSFAITTTAADFGVVGNPYSSTLATTGGTVPLMWTVSSGVMPSGLPDLSIDPVTGVVTGTPAIA